MENVGNSAAMREALEAIRGYAEECATKNPEIGEMVSFGWIAGKCRAALAAPPRNCDLYATAEEAAEAWHKHEAEDTGEKYCDGCPFNLGEDCVRGGVCSIGWFYAKAQEGGAK